MSPHEKGPSPGLLLYLCPYFRPLPRWNNTLGTLLLSPSPQQPSTRQLLRLLSILGLEYELNFPYRMALFSIYVTLSQIARPCPLSPPLLLALLVDFVLVGFSPSAGWSLPWQEDGVLLHWQVPVARPASQKPAAAGLLPSSVRCGSQALRRQAGSFSFIENLIFQPSTYEIFCPDVLSVGLSPWWAAGQGGSGPCVEIALPPSPCALGLWWKVQPRWGLPFNVFF